jgi:chromosome segregation ATPase
MKIIVMTMQRVQELEQALQDLEAKHAQETAELRSSLEAELAQLRKDLEESQRAAKDAQSAQEALQVQLSREEHLLQQIADLKKQQEEQVAAFSSAESDSTAMLQKLSDLRDQLETEKNSREGLNETIDKEKKNAAAAEARSRELELELAELQQRISQQSGVEDALLGANKERDEALRALDSLNVAHSRLDASNQLLTTENEHLKSRVVSLEEELARMKTLAQSGAVNSPATGIVAYVVSHNRGGWGNKRTARVCRKVVAFFFPI